MSFFSSLLKIALLSSLASFSVAQAYIYVPPTVFQEENNLVYLNLGGGVGKERANGTWIGQSGHADLNDPSQDESTIGVGNAAIGYAFKGYPFRIEVAYNFLGQGTFKWDHLEPPVRFPNESAKAKVYSHLGLANFYGELPFSENWMPYLKVGLGYGLNQAKFTYTDLATGKHYTSKTEDTNNFVWNAGAGLNYALSDNWSFGVEFLYTFLGKAKVNAEVPVSGVDEQMSLAEVDELYAVSVLANLAYHFSF